MKPLHYCPLCNADSWYAPQPPRDEWPKWQAYQCGTLTIYSENGERHQILPCRTEPLRYFPSTKSQAGLRSDIAEAT